MWVFKGIALTVILFLQCFVLPIYSEKDQCTESDGTCLQGQAEMWAATISSFGEPSEVLTFSTSFPKPFPEEHEVLVKLDARPVHPSDLLFIRGLYTPKDQFPQVPGAEGTGIIESVGQQVTNFKVGDRVTFWHSYEARLGTWAEYTVVPAEYLVPVPDDLSADAAAQLVLNPLTMIGIMDQFGDVQPGEWVIQNAANSACGKFLIQFLKQKGIKTINVVRHSESVEGLKALGADEVIALDTTAMQERVMEITNGQGVKYAIDCVWGAGAAADMVSTLAPMGKMISYGVLSGAETTLNIVPLLFGMRSIQGFAVNVWRKDLSDSQIQQMMSEVASSLKHGTISLPTEHFSPNNIIEAVMQSETPKKSSKAIIYG